MVYCLWFPVPDNILQVPYIIRRVHTLGVIRAGSCTSADMPLRNYRALGTFK
jgi:hypothetical protein